MRAGCAARQHADGSATRARSLGDSLRPETSDKDEAPAQCTLDSGTDRRTVLGPMPRSQADRSVDKSSADLEKVAVVRG